MEQEGRPGQEPDLSKAQELIEKAYAGSEEDEKAWVNEIQSKLTDPEAFLEMVKSDPRCEIIKKLAFDVKEGEKVPESGSGDLRPAGPVTMIEGKKYVGGWRVDELGFFAVPYDKTPAAVDKFNSLKTLWISANILGARKPAESEEKYQQRMAELEGRIEEYHRDIDK